MKAIIRQLFNKRIKTINLIQLINLGLVFLYAATFPMIAEQQEIMTDLLKSLPAELLKAFSIDNTTLMSFQSYLASKHIVPFWIIILLMVSIPAATFISKSVSNNTGELIFSQPASRKKISLSVLISALLQTIYYVLVSIVVMIGCCLLFAINIDYTGFFYFTIAGISFAFLTTPLLFFVDSILMDGGKVMGLSIVGIIGMYALDIVAKISDELDILKYFSIFYYYDFNKILGNDEINMWYISAAFVLGVLFSTLGIYIYNKRDLSR